MENKKYSLMTIIVFVLIASIIICMFYENKISKLEDEISIRNENINELQRNIQEHKDYDSKLDDMDKKVDTILDLIQ